MVRKSRLVVVFALLAAGVLSLSLLASTASAVAAADRTPRTPAVPMPACGERDSTVTTFLAPTTLAVVGQPIDVYVQVRNQCEGPTPTGSVTVSDGTHHCKAHLSGGGYMAGGGCTITAHAPGTYTLDASYSGDRRCSPSATTGTLIVAKATSTTALTLSVTTLTYGDEQVEHITATVSPQFAGTPRGTVKIKASKRTLCVITLSAAEGSCTLSATQLKTGTYDVVAHYSGSRGFMSSASSEETLTVAT
jgi:hypothetical protein